MNVNLQPLNDYRASFMFADCRDSEFAEKVLDNIDLRGADLSGVDLSKSSLQKALLIGADLSGANLSDADLSGVYMGEIEAEHILWRGANITSANLPNSFIDCLGETVIDSKVAFDNLFFREKLKPKSGSYRLEKSNWHGRDVMLIKFVADPNVVPPAPAPAA